jgi:hypothetical protein
MVYIRDEIANAMWEARGPIGPDSAAFHSCVT